MRAISNLEFAQAIRKIRPSEGWGDKVAVALSGGCDSACLVFLLQRLLSSDKGREAFQRQAAPTPLALIVDHQLQSASAQTAAVTSTYATSQAVPSRILSVQWGTRSFPPKPSSGFDYEDVARRARYRLMLSAMQEEEAKVLLMGHHADDQVETAIIRLRKGSGTIGLGAMRKLRRWGMSDGGIAGMQHWIARPLLEFPKDRLLATCHEHHLPYVTDITNFQPSLTLRNGIRDSLYSKERSRSRDEAASSIDLAVRLARSSTPLTQESDSLSLLRKWVSRNREYVEGIDMGATEYLSRYAQSSPPSTVFLQDGTTPPKDIQHSLIMRILRYVSPNPWGAPSAEAGRRQRSLEVIASNLWGTSRKDLTPGRKSFSAGAHVLWTPKSIDLSGRNHFSGNKPLHNIASRGWLVSRQPPLVKRKGLANDNLEIDISHDIASCPRRGSSAKGSSVEVLWDNRFIFRFDPHHPSWPLSSLPSDTQILIASHGRYHLPRLVLRASESATGGAIDVWRLSEDKISPFDNVSIDLGWIQVSSARVIDAI